MTDCVLLKQRIDESGISISFIADKIGISRETLYNKLCGKTEFKVSEVSTLARLLRLTPKEVDKIFFAR